MANAQIIAYKQVRQHIVQHFRTAKGTRPDVMQVVINGQDLVVKDYNPCSGWFGSIAGPILVKREIKALAKLQGITGVPELYQCDDKRVLITAYCPSQSAAKLDRALDWPLFEQRLNRLIAAMHRAGVAHCDLRGPGNILIDQQDRPYLVDYVACVLQAPAWNKPWNVLFKQACQADYSAVLKLKRKLVPDQLTQTEKQLVADQAEKGQLFRTTSRKLRQLARWLFAAGKDKN